MVYSMPILLIFVALAANLKCCTVTVFAFKCSRFNIRPIKQQGTRQSKPQPLFATLDDQKAEINIPTDAEHCSKSKVDAAVVETGPFEVTTIKELDDYFEDVSDRFRSELSGRVDYSALLASLSVKGDTQLIGSPNHRDVVHPVVQLLHERKRKIDEVKRTSPSSTPTSRNKRNVYRTMPPSDGYRVALAIEGGGMRGCVTAGMVTAIHYLGLEDTVDVVYGSSAGTVIGAYFITRQLPWFGPELYYDALTTAGDRFINTKRFLRAIGLGLLDPRLTKDVRVLRKFNDFYIKVHTPNFWTLSNYCRSSFVAIMVSQCWTYPIYSTRQCKKISLLIGKRLRKCKTCNR